MPSNLLVFDGFLGAKIHKLLRYFAAASRALWAHLTLVYADS